MAKQGPQLFPQSPLRGVVRPAGITQLVQVQRAMNLHQQGKLSEAADIYLSVLRINPNQADCLHYLGVIKHQNGLNEEAVDLIQKAIRLNKSNASAYCNLGLALHCLGRLQQALDSYDKALSLNRALPEVFNNRGNVWRDMGRFEEAIRNYDSAIALMPNYVEAYANRGMTCKRMGKLLESLRAYDKALSIKQRPEDFNALGIVQCELHRFDEALADFERALALNPNYIDAKSNKATALLQLGRHQEAVVALDQAISMAPGAADLRLKRLIARIPVIPDKNDDIPAIRRTYIKEIVEFSDWIDRHPVPNPLDVVGSFHPFYLAYHAQNNRELLAPYGNACAKLMARWSKEKGIEAAPAREVAESKIRIGIVSAHVIDHPVWNAIVRGWFQELDRERFEFHVYYLGSEEDGETRLAKERAAAFHSGIRPPQDWARLIVESAPDLLVYPEIGMDAVTPKLAAMRLAPVQIATWGHPETTGLPTMDWYWSAEAFEDAQSQACYTERLVSLPNLGCYYEPGAVDDADVDLQALGIKAGAPVFVCPGSPYKYAPQYDRVFVDIARHVPNAQFLFFKNPKVPAWSDLLQARLDRAFTEAGLDPSQFKVVIPWQQRAQFYSIMRQAAVFLDTIGFSGFNTAMQAIDCALPIVTMEGRFMRGRFGSAILKRISLEHLVQQDVEGYVGSAVKLATDSQYRQSAQATMVAKRHILYRDKVPMRALEETLINLCKGAA